MKMTPVTSSLVTHLRPTGTYDQRVRDWMGRLEDIVCEVMREKTHDGLAIRTPDMTPLFTMMDGILKDVGERRAYVHKSE